MRKQYRVFTDSFLFGAFIIFTATPLIADEQTIAPPALGEETKGQPALPETAPESVEKKTQSSDILSPLGTTKVTELRRESGQVYRIELEHSSGSKQYIDETGSDGKIESTSNDIEETPNLPKWKIGSW